MIKTVTVYGLMGEQLALVDEKLVRIVVENVMAGARAHWIKLAQERLTSTRRDYIAGLSPVQVSGMEVGLTLTGVLPNLVELGMDAFDMHATLLGPNVPVVPVGSGMKGKHRNAKGGFYRSIPFRHQAPGTIGQGGGTPMGKPYEGVVDDAKALGKAIHKAAKSLSPTTSTPNGGTEWGERLPPGLAPKLKEHHTTDIYDGMVRKEKTYGKATQSTYMTFRTISTSVPDKWLHPGIAPANIAEDVQRYVEDVLPKALAGLVIPE